MRWSQAWMFLALTEVLITAEQKQVSDLQQIHQEVEGLMNHGNFVQALNLMQARIVEEEMDWLLLLDKGWCFLHIQQPEDAIAYFKRAFDLLPEKDTENRSACYTFSGLAFMQLDDEENAKEQFELAINMHSNALNTNQLALLLMRQEMQSKPKPFFGKVYKPILKIQNKKPI